MSLVSTINKTADDWWACKFWLTKGPLGYIRVAKPQISLHSHDSGQDLRYQSYIFRKVTLLCKRTAKILTRQRRCAGWSGSSLFAYVLRSFFSLTDPNILQKYIYWEQTSTNICTDVFCRWLNNKWTLACKYEQMLRSKYITTLFIRPLLPLQLRLQRLGL